MPNSIEQLSAPKRTYKLGKRAEQQAATRKRIVQAAIELHSTVGPAGTTVAQIADRAGVQRHTYYAHFPEEWDLLLACSGMALERDPLPDLKDLLAIAPGSERIFRGLHRFYEWFAGNQQQAACVLRDAGHHEPTRRIVELRMAPAFSTAAEIMSKGLNPRSRTLLEVSLDFACWRLLAATCSPDQAARLMTDAIVRVAE